MPDKKEGGVCLIPTKKWRVNHCFRQCFEERRFLCGAKSIRLGALFPKTASKRYRATKLFEIFLPDFQGEAVAGEFFLRAALDIKIFVYTFVSLIQTAS
ncbi:hypothetical protein [Rufibacter immobilis]|uniref:hypothetical protein n=1 Tax=Rufibacter immobilis TaxID=1348778 RepID=UPI0035E7EC16